MSLSIATAVDVERYYWISTGRIHGRDPRLIGDSLSQKADTFLKPLVDQYAKEGKDKKVTFEANFSKPNAKPKWFFRKDVSVLENCLLVN